MKSNRIIDDIKKNSEARVILLKLKSTEDKLFRFISSNKDYLDHEYYKMLDKDYTTAESAFYEWANNLNLENDIIQEIREYFSKNPL